MTLRTGDPCMPADPTTKGLTWFAVLLVIGFFGLFATGAKAEDKPIAVQLKTLTIAAVTEKGYLGRTTVTPYMEVTNAEALKRLCSRLPRVLDVIVLAFEEKPMRLVDPVGDLMIRQDHLGQLIEGSVGQGVFKSIHIVPASKRRAEGTELLTVDGGFNDCQPLKAFPWDIKTAEKQDLPSVSGGESLTAERITPSPLSEEELAKAEAELMAEKPVVKPFPGAPLKVSPAGTSWILIALVLIGLAGLMLVIGSYIGYQVAKIRRERRRIERRKSRKDRRAGQDRRKMDAGLPAAGERRMGADRRQAADRRKAQDRRAERDRRDEN